MLDGLGIYLAIIFFAVLAFEILAGRHRGIYRKQDIAVTVVSEIFRKAATQPAAIFIYFVVLKFFIPQYEGSLSELPFLPCFLLTLVLADFAFYWVHRLAHEAKATRHQWLWKLHRTHHAGKYMNVTVTSRINIFWVLFAPIAWVSTIAIFLGQELAGVMTLVTIWGWNLLTHSNFRWDDYLRDNQYTRKPWAVFEHILITPGVHHTHHGYGRDGKSYRNYAVMFAWIDWMFGTLHIPKGRPAFYGIPGEHPHWAEEIFYPLIRVSDKKNKKKNKTMDSTPDPV